MHCIDVSKYFETRRLDGTKVNTRQPRTVGYWGRPAPLRQPGSSLVINTPH